jgi:hypothetical protein
MVSGSAPPAIIKKTVRVPTVAATGQPVLNELRIELPLPSPNVAPNTYKHWRTVSKAKKEYREVAELLALVAMREQGWVSSAHKLTMEVVYGCKGARAVKGYAPRDEANAHYALKAGVDGLIDAGVAPDDSHRFLTLGKMTIDPEQGPWVRITLRRNK